MTAHVREPQITHCVVILRKVVEDGLQDHARALKLVQRHVQKAYVVPNVGLPVVEFRRLNELLLNELRVVVVWQVAEGFKGQRSRTTRLVRDGT